MGHVFRKCAPHRGLAHGRAGVAGLQPALCEGHQQGSLRRGVLPLEAIDAVVGGGAMTTRDGDRGAVGASVGAVAAGGDGKFADRHRDGSDRPGQYRIQMNIR